MFKSWQIFVFSLIPLALVFAGVIIGSYHGSDSAKEIFPTAGPTAPPSETVGPGAPGVLAIAAQNLLFDKKTLEAPARTEITVRFDNRDAGVLHNVAFYTNRTARSKIFVGEIITGPKVIEYEFTTPAPGSFFFRCDVHPDTMTGTFTVK